MMKTPGLKTGAVKMSAGKRICKKCGTEFLLTPGKPGYANVCQDCSTPPKQQSDAQAKAQLREIYSEELRKRGVPEAEIEKRIDVIGRKPTSHYVEVLERIKQEISN